MCSCLHTPVHGYSFINMHKCLYTHTYACMYRKVHSSIYIIHTCTWIHIYIKHNAGFVSGGRSALQIQPGCLPRRCEVFSRFLGREHEQQLHLLSLSSDALVAATGLGLSDCISLCCCYCHLNYLKTLPESLSKDKGVLFLKYKV